ncbi:hypothetical protein [Streptomyces johnsoniae]|uniref:Uncharacterized protein n=1 Tax=Streptomyces johnsoniae TaxID=3075532 RepID=A0ABU2S012_9ACTN|nr:hypothetical protein [Streptomyces sp. DSM 41886]MDT0442344.1 hypothetical protein [Streptomyces sp. DSM 41886]
MIDLFPGDRVVVVTTDQWRALEMYGITGSVIDGPDERDEYGVMLDPEYDPDQLPISLKGSELDEIGAEATTGHVWRVRDRERPE